jgi:hypothetical protein
MTKPIFLAVALGFIVGVSATVIGPYEPVEVHRMPNGVTCKTHQAQAWLVCRSEKQPGLIGLLWSSPEDSIDLADSNGGGTYDRVSK